MACCRWQTVSVKFMITILFLLTYSLSISTFYLVSVLENLHNGTRSSTVHGHLRYTVTYGTRQKNIIDAILGLYRFVTASHNGTRNQKNNVHLRF